MSTCIILYYLSTEKQLYDYFRLGRLWNIHVIQELMLWYSALNMIHPRTIHISVFHINFIFAITRLTDNVTNQIIQGFDIWNWFVEWLNISKSLHKITMIFIFCVIWKNATTVFKRARGRMLPTIGKCSYSLLYTRRWPLKNYNIMESHFTKFKIKQKCSPSLSYNMFSMVVEIQCTGHCLDKPSPLHRI